MKKIILSLCLISSITSFACSPKDINLVSVDPISGGEFKLHVKAYIPKNPSDKQVIILPPIGGVTTLEAKYASKVCPRGTAAYVFVNWTDDMEESIEDLAVHNRGTLRGIHAVETFLNYSDMPTRVLGTSLGGIYAGIVTGKFSQIEKAVIIASGTNIAEIMATSSLPVAVKQRKERFELFGFETKEEYADAIKAQLTVEAATFKDNFKNKKLLVFKTNRDTVIRPKYQRELIDLFERDNTWIYANRRGHKDGIIWTYIRRSGRVVNFLTSK